MASGVVSEGASVDFSLGTPRMRIFKLILWKTLFRVRACYVAVNVTRFFFGSMKTGPKEN